MTNFRDRIAAAIAREAADIANANGGTIPDPLDCHPLADAVIAELGLTRVTRSQNPPIHRYVTEWTADD